MTLPGVHDTIIRLAGPPHLAVLTTLLADGQPQSHVVWVGYVGGELLVNTEAHRAKHRNVLRDPRVTVLLVDAADPHCFVEIRGEVAGIIRGERARMHVDELSLAYSGRPYDPSAIRSERVVLRITPRRCVLVAGRTYRTLVMDPRGGRSAESAPVPE